MDRHSHPHRGDAVYLLADCVSIFGVEVMDTQKLREEATDKVAEALGDAYDCTRTWQAWSYGTMGPDDFALVAEDDSRLSEIAEAALAPALAAINAQAAEIDGLRAELEHCSAYWITHRGAALACSGSMRDAYSDEKVRADAAEATIARLRIELGALIRGYVNLLENGRDRIKMLGGDCDQLDVMEASDPWLKSARAALAQEQS